MKSRLGYLLACLIAILGLSTILFTSPARAQQNPRPSTPAPAASAGARQGAQGTKEIEGEGVQMPRYKYDKPAGPAPRQDINGVWGGPISGKADPVPPLTAWGREKFAANKSNQNVNAALSNDPLNTCDPLGFPRNVIFELRGIQFVQAPTKMVELFQYQRVWREIWTDGRALPKNAGSAERDAPDPRYYGYSVGHWDGDYSFVVDSVGTDDRTWIDNTGHPHSSDLRVKENYTRLDQHTLQLTVTIDDPKTYTQPWMAGKTTFKWIPEQEFEEQLCLPSEAEQYLKLVADPAGLAGGK